MPIITLTTDFGEGSTYVGAMKGSLLSVNPLLTLVDITHAVPAQDVRAGALAIAEATPYFPQGTIHLVVVDPGVGTRRRLLYATLGPHHFLAPDNGVLELVARRTSPSLLIELTDPRWWRQPISQTFHGRDILGPVAAHLSLGTAPIEFGSRLESNQLTRLNWPAPRQLADGYEAEIVHIDSFGNLISNLSSDLRPAGQPIEIQVAGQTVNGLARTYGDRPAGELLALIGSTGRLELALNRGHAAHELPAHIGTRIVVRWGSPTP